MGMSRHVSAHPLWAYVQVNDYFDPSTSTLTHVKMIEMFVESVLATGYVWPTVAGYLFFLVRMYSSCEHVDNVTLYQISS
jgi:hypothetical protein